MLSGLLVLALLGGFRALAQAAPVPFDWGTVAGGAVSGIPVAAVLAWQVHQLYRKLDEREHKLDEKDAEIRQLHADNRAMTERIAVVLEQAITAMAEVREGMEATLDHDRPHLERVVRRMETLADELDRRGRPDGRR